MHIPISNITCLRLVKSMNMPVPDNLLCVGIDDWAKRKGMNYGSIIVNAETGRKYISFVSYQILFSDSPFGSFFLSG